MGSGLQKVGECALGLSGAEKLTIECRLSCVFAPRGSTVVCCPLYAGWKPPFVLFRVGFEDESDRPVCELLLAGSTEVVRVRSESALPLGGRRVGMVARFHGTRAQLFLDGEEVGSAPACGRLEASAQPVVVGDRSATTPGAPFEGWLERVRIWNAALGPGELEDAGRDNLVLSWP